jgi:Ser/Thr protein kinase RdoA (MazF antagonist)
MSEHPYDALTPETVIDAVESAGYLSDARLLALNSYENRVYQVGIEDAQPLIAKFYRPERWRHEQVLEEHSYSLELAEMGISVVAPLRNAHGDTLHHYQGFDFALFQRRGGYPPEFDNLDNLLILGRTLGRIHTVGAARPFEHRISLSAHRMVEEAGEFLLREFVPKALHEAYGSLLRDLARLSGELYGEVETADLIRVHGDCHVGNILWRDDVPHFVDLDDCVMAPAIQDLWMFLSGDRHRREQQLAELIEGYSEFADFSPRQLRWVEALRCMRMVNYAAWLGRRWDDPAFPRSFSWFNTERYWGEHILELREQLAEMQEPPLRLL